MKPRSLAEWSSTGAVWSSVLQAGNSITFRLDAGASFQIKGNDVFSSPEPTQGVTVVSEKNEK